MKIFSFVGLALAANSMIASGYTLPAGQQLIQSQLPQQASRADYLAPPEAPLPESVESVNFPEGGVSSQVPIPAGEPYAFAFDNAGDQFTNSRAEQSDGKKVTGHYTLASADGLQRIVHYVADKDGFRASIQTNEPGTESQSLPGVLVQSSQLPAAEIARQYGPGEPLAAQAPVAQKFVAPVDVQYGSASPAFQPAFSFKGDEQQTQQKEDEEEEISQQEQQQEEAEVKRPAPAPAPAPLPAPVKGRPQQVIQPTKTVQQPIKTVQQPTKTVQQPTKTVQQPTKAPAPAPLPAPLPAPVKGRPQQIIQTPAPIKGKPAPAPTKGKPAPAPVKGRPQAPIKIVQQVQQQTKGGSKRPVQQQQVVIVPRPLPAILPIPAPVKTVAKPTIITQQQQQQEEEEEEFIPQQQQQSSSSSSQQLGNTAELALEEASNDESNDQDF